MRNRGRGMSDFEKKFVAIMAFTLVLTGVLISSIFMQNIDFSSKSILKNVKIDNSLMQKSTIDNADIHNLSDNNVVVQNLTDCNDISDTDIEVLPLKKQGSAKIVMEQSSRRVLYDEGRNVRCYPASTTKILTALCVLENSSLSDIVTVPKQAEGVEGSSLYLKCGDKITVEDLLYGLMLRSGNDCAVALAINTSGSVDDFVKLMNETAKKLGANNSHFVNPHGLHDDLHYVTAYDLALICAKAYDNEQFCKIVGTKKRKIIVNDEQRYIANKNKLLSNFDGANGVKTGYTKKSGRCLVGGANRDGMQLISVVLNCADMWNDTVRILNFAFDNYYMCPLDKALLTNGSEEVRVVASQNVTQDWRDICYPIKKDGSEKIIVE